jgi:uncharacterized protein YifN (PemK superfamily)
LKKKYLNKHELIGCNDKQYNKNIKAYLKTKLFCHVERKTNTKYYKIENRNIDVIPILLKTEIYKCSDKFINILKYLVLASNHQHLFLKEKNRCN